MKHYKTVHVPATDKQELEKTICDICKEIIKDSGSGWCEEINLISSYDIFDIWDGHGTRKETEFDICSKCFNTKLITWMKEQGAEPRIEENDY